MTRLRPWPVLALSLAACTTPDSDARVDPIGPDRATFTPVANLLVRRCGTLDCHGAASKNLRLYGYGGLRLPGPGERLLPYQLTNGRREATPREVDADYESVVSLEPEPMRQVVLDRGAAPERLTLVRKARGTEEHKGKRPIEPGGPADRCLVSWLASAIDLAACEAAAADDPRPPP